MQRAAPRSSTPQGNVPAWAVWSALWSVYIVWGSTYLAIRVADRTLPPFLMAGARFILAGVVIYGWAVWRGETRYERPDRRNWLAATIVGGALLLGGNGGGGWGGQHNDSRLSALIVGTVAPWMALLLPGFFCPLLSL